MKLCLIRHACYISRENVVRGWGATTCDRNRLIVWVFTGQGGKNGYGVCDRRKRLGGGKAQARIKKTGREKVWPKKVEAKKYRM